jgi:hypothetical protein
MLGTNVTNGIKLPRMPLLYGAVRSTYGLPGRSPRGLGVRK